MEPIPLPPEDLGPPPPEKMLSVRLREFASFTLATTHLYLIFEEILVLIMEITALLLKLLF